MKRIAVVSAATKVADMGKFLLFRVFLEELGRHGFVEGQNLVVDRYSGEGRIEHYGDVAREAISRHPDLIFAPSGIPMASEFASRTTTIPIIIANTDPVATGLVSSLARPGGNITGTSTDGGREFHQKRLELLAQAMPKLSRVGYLTSQHQWEFPTGSAKVIREAAERASISLIGILLAPSMKPRTGARSIRWSKIN